MSERHQHMERARVGVDLGGLLEPVGHLHPGQFHRWVVQTWALGVIAYQGCLGDLRACLDHCVVPGI